MKRSPKYDKSVFQSLTMIMQFGINMLVPIFMMSALGIYLDRKLGTSFIMIILFFAGAAAGAQNVYRMAKKIGNSAKEEERKSRRKDDDIRETQKER